MALIGSYTPRKCGIATFTRDIEQQFKAFRPDVGVDIYALDAPGSQLDYSGVALKIAQDLVDDYRLAARRINESAVDAVWVQHEYGIFGGPDGEMIRELVDRIAAPLVLTLHTVLADPSERQEAILRHLISRASRIMLMSQHSRDLLEHRYGAPRDIIEVIPHGAPDRPFGGEEAFKARLGLTGRKVLTTFGLLGPGKGLREAIDALPAIVARHPEVIYRIVGATHPTLVQNEGEAYRESLVARADELGVSDHIVWENRFVDTEELLDQLEACDIYLTPYPNLQQSTSGTLSYAVALGKAVISTPYLHARELLADGAGLLIENNSSGAIAQAVNRLLDNPEQLLGLKRRAYAKGRQTTWPSFAAATAGLLENAVAAPAKDVPLTATPGLGAVLAMSDTTGMHQHSIGIVPDRRHGYCLDDNARALMLVNVARGLTRHERLGLQTTYASFVQHAWNQDLGVFRNFMRFDRTWCEDVGSTDSNGRAIWALGQTAELAEDPDIRSWAQEWYNCVYLTALKFDSPRSIAFAMLGAAAVQRSGAEHTGARDQLLRGGDLLSRLLDTERRPDWSWFEAILGYDNPRLPQALIEAGEMCKRPDWIAAGIETLEWIAGQQLAATGNFRPIGAESFGKPYNALPFDQQPLESQAAIEAALTAYRVTGETRWVKHAEAAYRWFFGANDRGAVLADLATGRCRDGVTPRGVNANCGAESILALQLAHYAMLAIMEARPATGPGDSPVSGSHGESFEPGPQIRYQPAAHS